MDKGKLRSQTKKALAELAKKRAIKGWHAMTKDQLVRALARHARPIGRKAAATKRVQTKATHRTGRKPAPRSNGRRRKTTDMPHARQPRLAIRAGGEHIVLTLQDSHWLHATWQISRLSIARAEAALGQNWHGAKPILRLFDVTSEDTTSATEMKLRDIPINGDVTTWYIDVVPADRAPRAYRVDIGFVTRKGRFYALARSNAVRMPTSSTGDELDENWTTVRRKLRSRKANGSQPGTFGNSAEVRRLFEGQLRLPMNGGGLAVGERIGRPGQKELSFDLEAELIVYGVTSPRSNVSVLGDSVRLRKDGTFTMRFSLPEGRQIIPAVAVSRDGSQEQTVILAVERNTKRLDPIGKPTEKR